MKMLPSSWPRKKAKRERRCIAAGVVSASALEQHVSTHFANLNQLHLLQTRMLAFADNDVVVQGDAERRWMRGSAPPTVRSAIFS